MFIYTVFNQSFRFHRQFSNPPNGWYWFRCIAAFLYLKWNFFAIWMLFVYLFVAILSIYIDLSVKSFHEHWHFIGDWHCHQRAVSFSFHFFLLSNLLLQMLKRMAKFLLSKLTLYSVFHSLTHSLTYTLSLCYLRVAIDKYAIYKWLKNNCHLLYHANTITLHLSVCDF